MRATSWALATAVQGPMHAPGSKAPIPSAIPRSARTKWACIACSGSSPSPAGFPPTCAPNTLAHFTRGASSAYSLLHAYGAALDHPELTVFCVVGDGEAETGGAGGELAREQVHQSGRDGTVLPILHLNGYKIANPTILARIPSQDLCRPPSWLRVRPSRRDHRPHHQPGRSTPVVRQRARSMPRRDRTHSTTDVGRGGEHLPRWPMIVLRSPKGWHRATDGRRPAGRGHLSGLTRFPSRPLVPTQPTGQPWRMDEVLPTRRALRRRRPARSKSSLPCRRRASDG